MPEVASLVENRLAEARISIATAIRLLADLDALPTRSAAALDDIKLPHN